MVDRLYSDAILDHYKNPRSQGVLESADFSHEDAGSVCGDEIRIDLRVTDGAVSAVAFSGRGCAVSQASASILTELVVNLALDRVTALTTDDLLGALGVRLSPSRLECALLSLHVLKTALCAAESGNER